MRNVELYTYTPMGQAVLEALRQVNETIVENITAAGPGQFKAYVFGGAALHLLTNVRGSADIDVEVVASSRLDLSDIVVTYQDSDGQQLLLVIDTEFHTGISGMLHDDYRENAIPLEHNPDAPLHTFVLSPLDLAVSKLDRLAANDQNDIEALFKCGLFTVEELSDHALDALEAAIGPQVRLKGNIDYMLQKLRAIANESEEPSLSTSASHTSQRRPPDR